jgi:hypothetical protein
MISMVVERQGKVCEFGYDAEHTAVVRTAHQLREEEEKEKSYRKEWEENSDERKVRGNGRVLKNEE